MTIVAVASPPSNGQTSDQQGEQQLHVTPTHLTPLLAESLPFHHRCRGNARI